MSEPHISKPLDGARAEQVWAALAEQVTPLPAVAVAAADALGAVLAAPVCAGHDFPPFDRAVMDGFAVRRDTFQNGAATLRNVGLIRADAAGGEQIVLRPGEPTCARINTGAPIPQGADAVVMVERAEETTAGAHLKDDPAPGQHIERRGALRKAGDVVLERGERVTAGGLATIAAAGQAQVSIYRRARVCVLTTGDELVTPGADLAHGQIYDSNGVMLAEFCRAAGADVVSAGRCGDQEAALRETLTHAMKADVVIVAGGMSKGSHDLVPGALEALGVRWLIRSLHLKPGKPTRIGRGPGGAWVFGLPGNPVSCAVCFLLFTRFLIDGLHGLAPRAPRWLKCASQRALDANGARPLFQPARWSIGERGAAQIAPIDWRGSGDPFGMSTANALLYRDANAPAVWEGELAEAMILGAPL